MQTSKTRYNVGRFLNQFARRDGGPTRLWALVFAATPTAWRQAA